MPGTIKQIAQMAGVSRGTVDRVLNHRGRVRPEVTRRVEEIAAEIGYEVKHPKETNPEKTPVQPAPSSPKKIGVITQLSGASFMKEIHRGIKDATDHLERQGVTVCLKESAEVSEEEQPRQIDELLAEGIDGLALMPVECDSVRTKINDLTEQNLPVVTFNSDIVGTDRMCFVGLDNRRSGETAAGLLAQLLRKKGKVLAITGSFANNAGNLRIDGFVEELKKSYPEMELVGVQSSSDRAEEVEEIIVHAMTAFPDLAGILVVSGGQAGVKKAFERLGRRDRPFVILYDLTEENRQILTEDGADFLIDQDGYTQGYQSLMLLADKILSGIEPSEECLYTAISIRTKYNL